MLAAFVAVGGAVGALLRYGADMAIMRSVGGAAVVAGGFPWATLVINVSGAMALGALYAVSQSRLGLPDQTWIFLSVGVLGSYTTFSTVALDAVMLAEADAWARAGVYLIVMPVLGMTAGIAAYAGLRALLS